MMKLDYISDLHLNHYVRFKNSQEKWKSETKKWAKQLLATSNSGAKYLVLAGDYSEWNRQTIWLLEEASKMYEKIMFVIGNHDYYLLSKNQENKYGDSIGRKEKLLEKASNITGVIPLDKTKVTLEGKVIAGDSLWYNLTTEEFKAFYLEQSNDSLFIKKNGCTDPLEVAKKLYKESMEWYNDLEGSRIDLMISHIPPVHPDASPFQRNQCYECEVPFLVSKNWIAGHQHIQTEFEKYGTNFYMNPLGYPSENNKMIIKTIKI